MVAPPPDTKTKFEGTSLPNGQGWSRTRPRGGDGVVARDDADVLVGGADLVLRDAEGPRSGHAVGGGVAGEQRGEAG